MMYEFKNEYKTGIEAIDIEHKKFFDYINQGVEALDMPDPDGITEAKKILASLTDYATNHLVHEEEYMRKTKDVMLLPQMGYHQQFRDRIKAFLAKKDMNKKDVGDIFVFMAKWLREHILASDLKIGVSHGESIINMSDDFLTGIELIDEEHRQLFDIIGRAYAVMEDEYAYDKYDAIVSILTELKEYTIFHFSDEENYMQSIGYDGYEAQKKVHDAFIEKIVDLDFGQMEAMDDNQSQFLKELMDFLTEWLIGHILNMDKKIPVQK